MNKLPVNPSPSRPSLTNYRPATQCRPSTAFGFADAFAASVQATHVPMIITDPHEADNPVVFLNDAFCALTGYARDEILGRNCRFLQGPDTDPAALDQIYAALSTETSIEVEIRNYRKSGQPFWNRLLIAPVHDSTGALSHYFGNQLDVTAERERIAELQNRNDALTAFTELLEDQGRELVAANAKLQAEVRERQRVEAALQQLHKVEAIGQLTGGIAHDFNNMLGGITGSLELLQRSVTAGRSDDLERYTAAALTSAQRAASLTRRLLAFARRQPLKPERADMNQLVARMEDLLQRTLGPSIEIEMLLANRLRNSLCDPNLLESAILNLAINARDAMPGGGRLTIATANAHIDETNTSAEEGELKPGHYVTLSVTDTGTGMSPAVIARAFEPFFTTKPLGQGTGLGLSMVYGFVKQSDGHVSIRSKRGLGTTFKLYLPCYPGTAAEEPHEPVQMAVTQVAACRTNAAATVLVVDDEETFRMVVNETLGDLGYTTTEAADGPTALQILQSDTHIDLLVTDIGLPGLDGRQLAAAARKLRPALPILFITGYNSNEAIGNTGGPDPDMAVLSKPFPLSALGNAVRDMLVAR